MYTIIETTDKGKVMVATHDMLPGTEVVQEEAIMCMPQVFIDPCTARFCCRDYGIICFL